MLINAKCLNVWIPFLQCAHLNFKEGICIIILQLCLFFWLYTPKNWFNEPPLSRQGFNSSCQVMKSKHSTASDRTALDISSVVFGFPMNSNPGERFLLAVLWLALYSPNEMTLLVSFIELSPFMLWYDQLNIFHPALFVTIKYIGISVGILLISSFFSRI